MYFKEYLKATILLNLEKTKQKYKDYLHLVWRLSYTGGSGGILRNAF